MTGERIITSQVHCEFRAEQENRKDFFFAVNILSEYAIILPVYKLQPTPLYYPYLIMTLEVYTSKTNISMVSPVLNNQKPLFQAR